MKSDTADFGVIPLENSLSGSIHENYDILNEYDLNIIGEIKLRIMHHLMTNPGVEIDDIRRVFSHPQVFGQCRQFLEQHDWELVSVSDTAAAAQRVADGRNNGNAAIASLVAAEEYGLNDSGEHRNQPAQLHPFCHHRQVPAFHGNNRQDIANLFHSQQARSTLRTLKMSLKTAST